MFPLIAYLSEPIQSDELLQRVMLSSLEGYFGADKATSIVHLIDSRVAAVWISNHARCETLLRSSRWTLTVGLSCRFAQVTNQHYCRSLEIYNVGSSRSIDMSLEWRQLQQFANCDPRNVLICENRIFLTYSSLDYTMKTARLISDALQKSGRTREIAVRVVMVQQLKVVATSLQAPYRYHQMVQSLFSQRCSFLELVQTSLRRSKLDFPVIVGAICAERENDLVSLEESIFLICPSDADAHAIESLDSISLSSNCFLKVNSSFDRWRGVRVFGNSSVASSKLSNSSKHATIGLILWDIASCPINPLDHQQVSEELQKLLLRNSRKSSNFSRLEKFIFVSKGALENQTLELLSWNDWKIISLSPHANVHELMRRQIEQVFQDHQLEGIRLEICMCCSTTSCGVVLTGIRPSPLLEVVLVQNDFFADNFSHLLVKKVLIWDSLVRSALNSSDSSTLSSVPLSAIVGTNKDLVEAALAWDDTSIGDKNTVNGSSWDNVSAITMPTTLSAHIPLGSTVNTFSTTSLLSVAEGDCFPQDSSRLSIHSVSSSEHEIFIELPSTLLVGFVQKLLQWGSDRNVRQLLYGEDLTGVDLSRDIGNISLVEKSNKIGLVVSGRSVSVVELRSLRIRMLIEQAFQTHHCFPLHGWTPQHMSALAGSELLEQQENLEKCVASFSLNNDILYADVVALSSPSIARFAAFLTNLHPLESLWRFPRRAMVVLNSAEMEVLHQKFALKLEPAIQDSNIDICSVHAFGFGDDFEQAHSVINSMFVDPTNWFAEKRTWHSISPASSNSIVNVPTPMEAHRAVPMRETIRRLHRGSYSFADREAGIFFFAFEQQFRDYLERSFSVLVEDSDNPAEFRPKQTRGSQWEINESGGDFLNKNVVLKISFYGNTAKNVSAARAYLEQLNTTNVARVQIFFPLVSSKKFKEIYNKKSIQLTMLNNERLRAASEDSLHQVIDPLHHKGFINIRMKPPMHCHGIRKMALPADVTVTICGSVLAMGNEILLKEVESVFNSIKSDYLFVAVNIPYTHPLKKQLTIKTMREEIIQKYGLVALKWEEGCRATGSVGTAKIWATNEESLTALMDEIQSAELESERFGNTGLGFSYSPQSQFETAFANSAMPAHAVNSLATSLNALGLSDVLCEGDMSPSAPEARAVVYLPDLTLRYVLLGPPLNTQMTELLQKFNGNGVRTKYPYRDRTDPHAAVLLEGSSASVATALKEANLLVQTAAKNLEGVQVVVTDEQYRSILANDLACVKFVQGQAGVHMKLDPSQYENESARSLFDFRHLKSSPNNSSCTSPSLASFGTGLRENLVDRAQLAVSVPSSVPGCSIEVAVMPKISIDGSWSNSVDCFIMFVTPKCFDGLDKEDWKTLQKESVLKKKRAGSLVFTWLLNENGNNQAVVSKAISMAMEGAAPTLCVVPPSDCIDATKREVVELVVGSLKQQPPSIRSTTILLVDKVSDDFFVGLSPISPQCGPVSPSETPTKTQSIDHNLNSPLVQALLSLVDKTEAATDNFPRFDRYRGIGMQDTANRVSLSICNVALPVSFFAPLNRSGSQTTIRGSKVFVMKGLVSGLESGLAILRNALCGTTFKS